MQWMRVAKQSHPVIICALFSQYILIHIGTASVAPVDANRGEGISIDGAKRTDDHVDGNGCKIIHPPVGKKLYYSRYRNGHACPELAIYSRCCILYTLSFRI